MSNTNSDFQELKRSQDALEAKLRDIIPRSPSLRRAADDIKMPRLKARQTQLRKEVAVLEFRLGQKKHDPDWLCYLPSAAGSAEFIQRACTYLERFRHRVEAEGKRMWLCKDHDFVTRVFTISEFRAIAGNIFCSGQWSDRKYRQRFKGVSPDNATFAGDIDLLLEKETPACMLIPEPAMFVFSLTSVTRLTGPPWTPIRTRILG
jgi:hypothetical protein